MSDEDLPSSKVPRASERRDKRDKRVGCKGGGTREEDAQAQAQARRLEQEV